jgi:hypothetical protein
MVNAQARKMINAWTKWIMFLVRPRFPPDGLGIRSAMLGEDCKGGFNPSGFTRQRGQVYHRIARKRRKGTDDSVGLGRTRSGMRRYVQEVGEWTTGDFEIVRGRAAFLGFDVSLVCAVPRKFCPNGWK